ELLESDDPMPWWSGVRAQRTEDAIHLHVNSRLGYRLLLRLHHLELYRPEGLSFAADGDVTGRGTLRVDADGRRASRLEIRWRVSTYAPWTVRTDRWLRPVFVVGHRIVMWTGGRQLNRWLVERQPPVSQRRV